MAAHADPSTLYVNQNSSAHCSDSGPGTQAQPFCTVQAAADVAQPGQTVRITAGYYPEQVTLKHSGAPGQPITFVGALRGTNRLTSVGVNGDATGSQDTPHAFVASGVHDIAIQDLHFMTAQEAVLATDSDRIALDGNVFLWAGAKPTPTSTATPAVRLTGRTTGTTISRNDFGGSGTAGVAVDAGVAGTVITTNVFTANMAGAVTVTDAPGTVVTGNSIAENCGGGITLAGNSSGSTVENNIIVSNTLAYCADSDHEVDLSVSAGSTSGTKADYNVVRPAEGGTAYSWGGTGYASPTAFRAATGQGAHDLAVDPKFDLLGSAGENLTPTADTTAMDSADADAPGRLDTDLYGNPRVDNPNEPNTGTGSGYVDRGAIEYQSPLKVSLSASPGTQAGHPLDASISGSISAPWAPATATLEFGDGSSVPVSTSSFPLAHAYGGPGTYTLTLTAVDSGGTTRQATTTVTIQPVGPLKADLWVYQTPGSPAHVSATTGNSSSPWPATYRFDFGDGTPAVVSSGPNAPGSVPHDYAAPGQYPATLTLTDDHGRTATADSRVQINFAVPGDVPIAGRWVSGRAAANGMFNKGSWALRSTGMGGVADVSKVGFGQAGDLPAVADWDGVGHDQLGIYRQGVFALRHESGNATAVSFGAAGDVPVPGYWDHNGHAQLAIYRPSTHTFAVRHDDGSVSTVSLGDSGDIPVVGDWDGVGHTQMGVFRQNFGVFALRHDDGSISTASYGVNGLLPIVGDWMNAGRATHGVYVPSNATFWLTNAYVGKQDYINQLY
ncbi:PKD domain-containing protein [Kitasatospora sp. YST-16]|uniref:PKD domain-containing protein n=1 Tax=Kitasatospora sp. YST-16 TaxID=2998080 RepID=UPI0022834895|nr:PKD domain-containing protein [Kitasatospora sp. YST-16]WAL72984.1 PKD domain-containing protein [Kitasatospora sp. YST-16]WNW39033.1 PKD domain-containing protein [Streptomyces sp. Li-HN-5-13]